MNSSVIDQKVLAVYFDENSQVAQIANYGLQDGQIFDFVSRTTPTGGKDFSFLSQLFAGVGKLGRLGADRPRRRSRPERHRRACRCGLGV